MSSECRTRNIEWLRADYARENGHPFEHFYCPMLMKDEDIDLLDGHVVNERFKPEFKIRQRGDIDSWYGSMFEADFLTLLENRGKNIEELLFSQKKGRKKKSDRKSGGSARRLPVILKAKGQQVDYYHLEDDSVAKPLDERTVLELNGKNGGFLRMALKKSPEEVRSLQHVRWHAEAFGDFRLAALVSLIKAAYLTLFWKLGYKYTLSSAGLSVGRDILGRFFLENRGKTSQQVWAAAEEFFGPYVNMVRPVEQVGENAPRGTIEDNRVFVWLGSSGRGLGIGVFIRTDDKLHCVLMPAYSDAEGTGTYFDFLGNDKEEIWVREGQWNTAGGCWEVHPLRLRVAWPKLNASFDLSRPPQEILGYCPPSKEQTA